MEKTFFWAIPTWVTPNFFTWLRIISVPFVYYLLVSGQVFWGFALFFASVLTDLIDGALARTRNQITTFGKVFDPIADKLLILAALGYVGFDNDLVRYFSIFIALEMLAVVGGVVFAKKIGEPIGANTFGKIKMWLQTFGIFFYLWGVIFGVQYLINGSYFLLALAFVFALIAGVVQFWRRFFSIRSYRKSLKNRV